MLVLDPERLAHAFTDQLITYSSGAPISFSDRVAVEAILAKVRPQQYGLRSLLHAIIQSDLFRSK